jgi:serine phosphatase RsbU (regulator of sigma subunit)
VVGSVNYASRLQRGQLPRQMRIDGRFASFATIWEPRDTIGGDLYWLSSSQQSGPFVLAVADCTGHGVPGAMLSLLVSNSLERIYANDTTEDPATALTSLDHYVRTGLNQDRADSESDDGCDAAVLRIDRDGKTIEFAGAKLGLFQVSAQGEVTRHQGARCSLGYQDTIEDKDKPVVQTIRYQAGDAFAIVTDGLTDQIGGNASIKTSFGYRRIENILKANCISDADYIAYMLKNDFLAWQDNETRRDDLTAVVFKL